MLILQSIYNEYSSQIYDSNQKICVKIEAWVKKKLKNLTIKKIINRISKYSY